MIILLPLALLAYYLLTQPDPLRIRDRVTVVSGRALIQMTKGRPDQSPCPSCGEWVDNEDCMPVLAHVAPMRNACGWCSHPSRDGDGKGGWVCGICGDVEVEL